MKCIVNYKLQFEKIVDNKVIFKKYHILRISGFIIISLMLFVFYGNFFEKLQ